jgi:NAD(P)-dependent dehydrogenase (short-subunit alcohol dehydrogenase family)
MAKPMVTRTALVTGGNRGIGFEVYLLEVAEDTLLEALAVNFLGPLHLSRALVPPMLRAGYGRVVNITSGYGSFSSGLAGPAPYSLSKAALNALTLRLSSEVKGDVAVNAVDPGWVKTRMGGRAAPRSVEQGADTIVWLATHPSPAPNGSLFPQPPRGPLVIRSSSRDRKATAPGQERRAERPRQSFVPRAS